MSITSHKTFRWVLLQALLFFLALPVVYSQSYYFDNYSAAEGLGQSTVYAIIQDSHHIIWLGTQSGVSRFDGRSFENLTKEDGLAPYGVRSIYEDSHNTIWLGHSGGGITRCSASGFEVISLPGKLIKGDITSIVEDYRGHLWITTYGSGAFETDNPQAKAQDLHFTQYKGDKLSDLISGYTLTPDSSLYFITDVGIKKFIPGNRTFANFNVDGLTNYFARTCMLEDRLGNIWFGTFHGGLYKFSRKTGKFTIYDKRDGLSSNWISTIFEDSQGRVWVGTWGGGITRFDSKGMTVFNTDNGLQDNKIRYITEDVEGNILIGTNENGMSIFKGDQFITFSRKDGLKDPQVWAICQDSRSNYWFGTNEGITVYNPSALAGKRYWYFNEDTHLIRNQVRFIRRDLQGNMWIATYDGGIYKYDFSTGKFFYDTQINTSGLLPEVMTVTSMVIDPKNIIWFGTLEGLAYYDIRKQTGDRLVQESGLPAREITSVYCSPKGIIWVGARGGGIYRQIKDSFRFKNLDTLVSITPMCFTEDRSDNIWIGTEGQGLFQLHNNRVMRHFTEKDGLLANLVNLLITDRNGNIYIGTNKGLNKYVPTTGKFYTYTRKNGFTGIETRYNAAYRDNRGNLWFGTVNGAIQYQPALDNRKEIEPLTTIRRLRVNFADRPLTDGLHLKYFENNIIFDYNSICLTNPEAVIYQVRLKGADVDWQPVTQQTMVSYPSLTPKKYVFQVRARNSAGIWNSVPVSFSFQISPPFYKTWWFILISIFSGALLIVLYVAIRERNLINEKKVLEEKVRERTHEVTRKNEELAMKNKDITDSLRYAQRLQFAMLMPYVPFKNAFILFKPKDIVSGDFYWMHTGEKLEYMAAVDCTGHGVPGAFMSFIGFNSLNKIVKEYKIHEPAAILEHLNMEVTLSLHQQGDQGEINDGMDIALVCYNKETSELSFAGAFNPLYICRNGKIIEYKPDRFPIGRQTPASRKFTNHTLTIEKGDSLYIFTDGYADQIGGASGKKYKASRIRELLVSIQDLSMEEQEVRLEKELEAWRGREEQVDDILFIGRKF